MASKRLFVALVIVLITGFGVFKVYEGKLHFQEVAATLPEQLAAAKAEGVPLEANDLRSGKVLAPALNAATYYRKAIAAWDKVAPVDRLSLEKSARELTKAVTSAHIAAFESGLKKVPDVLRLVDQAVALPDCDFERHWEDGVAVEFSEFRYMKLFATINSARGILAWLRSNWQEARTCFRTADAIAAHGGQEPHVIGMLVSLACRGINLGALDTAVSAKADAAEGLAGGEALLKTLSPPPDFKRALRGEAVIGRITASKFSAEFIEGLLHDDEVATLERFKYVPFGVTSDLQQRAYEARLVETWREIFKSIASDNDPAVMGAKVDAIAARSNSDKDPTLLLNAFMVPMVTSSGQSLVIFQARRAVLLAKIKVLQFRNRTGKYPASLAEVGVLPGDPFTGQPLKYKVRSNWFAVYSVGADGKDDGGAAKSSKDIFVEHPKMQR